MIVRPDARLLAAVGIGTALEWFDFTLFALFSVQIANAFFPADDPLFSLMLTYMSMAVGFCARPLGAWFIGRYADQRGRKAALTLSIILMGIGTLIIAVCPTYKSIGVLAPVAVVTARIIQGIAAGGELGGALAYLCEIAPERQRGWYASFQQVAQAGSFLLCGLSASLISSLLTAGQLHDWGWRLPYLAGLAVVLMGIFIRRNLSESPEFQILTNSSTARQRQPCDLRMYLKSVMVGIAIVVVWTAATQLINFMPTYAVMVLKISPKDAYLGVTFVGVITLCCPLAAMLSDRIGRYPVMLMATMGILIMVYPAFFLLNRDANGHALIIFQCTMALFIAIYTGPASAALAELFPVHVRALGISFSYAIAVMVFGSSTPALITLLYRETGDGLVAAHWLFICACLSFAPLAWWYFKKGRQAEVFNQPMEEAS